MPDGPNYEQLFTGMRTLLGTNENDVKTIVRWLRFYKDQEGYEMYLNHYLPLLPKEAAAEFEPKVEVKEEEVSISPKKKGRPSKK